ncbi:MAG TPA: LysR family transcriptional regulator [Gammaproteobacteria bacterium]|nr:LysR family transcriptional regulator [Gammaproteobacteria bacterium]
MTTNRPQTLDLSTLRSFVTIAETGSMTRAAERLFLTQSAISMQIKRLEASLGFSVFERSARGMAPTGEGEQLLIFALQMLALNDEAMGRLTSPDFEGLVRFGVPGDIVYPQIPQVLKAFTRDYPRVQVKFTTMGTHKLIREYEQGLQDIVLTTEQGPREGGEVIVTHPLVWTGAIDGSSWKKRPLPLGFASKCAFRAGVTTALEAAGIPWSDQVISENEIAIEAMVAADLCVSAELQTANLPGREVIDHGGHLPELPEHSIVLYCNDKRSSPIVQTLAEYLRRAHN